MVVEIVRQGRLTVAAPKSSVPALASNVVEETREALERERSESELIRGMVFLPDTSCMVAAMCTWHVQHKPVVAELERRLARGEAMVIAAVTLVESYAVLTRLPPPHRIAPSDALALIVANFMNGAQTVALGPDAYHALLRQAPSKGVAGGRSYEAVIAACASQARAAALLTLNGRHFEPFATREMAVVVPQEPA